MLGNHALDTNSVVGYQADLTITDRGSDWYWTVCALMALSTFAFMGLSYTKRKTHRLFHYISAGITLVASIAYFCMAAGLGQTPVQVEFVRSNSMDVFAAGTRQIFWVRFVDYAITTPLILTNLLLTSSIPRPTMLATLLADELMVVCYLAGALTQTSYKWGFFVFGLFAYFFVVYSLMFDGRRYASALGGPANKTFLSCAGLTVFIWFLYPIAWGISVGGNVIHPDSEAIFFGILDIASKIVVGFLLVFGHKKIDPADLGLNIREHTTLPRHEKHGAGGNHRDNKDHHGPRKGLAALGHRNKGMQSNNKVTDYHDKHDHYNGLSNHRDTTTMGRHSKVTDHHDGVANHRDSAMRSNTEVADYDRPSKHHSGVSNQRDTIMSRNHEGTDHHDRINDPHDGHLGRTDDPYNEDSDYYDRGPNHHRRQNKPKGGGIMGLFRKKNHHDERDHEYRGQNRNFDRDGYYGRDRSPGRDHHQRDRRSRSRGDYDAREHSPLRGEYRTGQRSPDRGGYRRSSRSPARRDGYHPDGRRSFPGNDNSGDNRRSFPGGGYHPDGHRSFPGNEHYGDGRRSFPGGAEHRGEARRSGPVGGDYNNQDGRRHILGGEHQTEDPRSITGTDRDRQNIRSVPGGDFTASDRRPVPNAEHNRQALRPALGNEGHGDIVHAVTGDEFRADNRRPSGEYRPDNRRPSGEYRQDKRHIPGEFQETQGSNLTSVNQGPLPGPEHV